MYKITDNARLHYIYGEGSLRDIMGCWPEPTRDYYIDAVERNGKMKIMFQRIIRGGKWTQILVDHDTPPEEIKRRAHTFFLGDKPLARSVAELEKQKVEDDSTRLDKLAEETERELEHNIGLASRTTFNVPSKFFGDKK